MKNKATKKLYQKVKIKNKKGFGNQNTNSINVIVNPKDDDEDENGEAVMPQGALLNKVNAITNQGMSGQDMSYILGQAREQNENLTQGMVNQKFEEMKQQQVSEAVNTDNVIDAQQQRQMEVEQDNQELVEQLKQERAINENYKEAAQDEFVGIVETLRNVEAERQCLEQENSAYIQEVAEARAFVRELAEIDDAAESLLQRQSGVEHEEPITPEMLRQSSPAIAQAPSPVPQKVMERSKRKPNVPPPNFTAPKLTAQERAKQEAEGFMKNEKRSRGGGSGF